MSDGIHFYIGDRAVSFEEAGEHVTHMLAEHLEMELERVKVTIHDVSDDEDAEHCMTVYHVEIDGNADIDPALTQKIKDFLGTIHPSSVMEVPSA